MGRIPRVCDKEAMVDIDKLRPDLDKLRRPQNAIKLFEFVLALVIVCLAYAPDCNLLLSANEAAGVSLNIFVIVGYFFIIAVQLLGALGDKNAMPVTNLLFALFGAIFHLSSGSLFLCIWTVKISKGDSANCRIYGLTLGSLMIFQSVLMLLETALQSLHMKNERPNVLSSEVKE